MLIKNSLKNLTKFEIFLWVFSVVGVTVSFLLGSEKEALTLVTSLVGVSALIFTAKGDVVGQFLIVAFAILYGIISFNSSYYGEMITYVGMSAPIAVVSIISWLKNPYEKGKNEVRVAKRLSKKKLVTLAVTAALVTLAFYFILKAFNNASLIVSTISVTTSFTAAFLTVCRSPFYAVAYALNDIVLIILWVIATVKEPSLFPMIICFAIFLINDTYGFINWQRMKRRQEQKNTQAQQNPNIMQQSEN